MCFQTNKKSNNQLHIYELLTIMSKFFSEAVKFVVKNEQQSVVNTIIIAKPKRFKTTNLRVNTHNQHSLNRRYKQEHNRRKHNIKQPGVDVQRKNFNRKTRR